MADVPKDSGNGRNRKRFLELSDGCDEEASRRQNLLNGWQENLKMRMPTKAALEKLNFLGHLNLSEAGYNDLAIDQGLADNFEDSLSGLGVDISTVSYDMSEAILALPSVTAYKQEVSPPPNSSTSTTPIPDVFDDHSQGNTTDKIFRLLALDSKGDSHSANIHQLFQQHLYSDGHQLGDDSPHKDETLSINYTSRPESANDQFDSYESPVIEDNRFQYILGATTSIATKMSEETLTYLNQGQSYEVKVKKLGDITRLQGKYYHTKVRLCFQDRRLQFAEKEQLENWKRFRPGERLIEIDVPLSYGILDVIEDSRYFNVCEFDWDPTKEVGVYIKVNCISTEFTPKKHGGEKGVPFRLQVESYDKGDTDYDNLYNCSCQIKVFKLKGADRKHKQDKERACKRSPDEQDKYQKQCECTILQQLSSENVYVSPNPEEEGSFNEANTSSRSSPTGSGGSQPAVAPHQNGGLLQSILPHAISPTELSKEEIVELLPTEGDVPLLANTSALDVQVWLTGNRFNKHSAVLVNFNGNDLLRLSRAELRELCGLADGIRLYNAIHSRAVSPRLTLYVWCESDDDHVFNAVYLENATVEEFVRKVCRFVKFHPSQIYDMYLYGPSDIHVVLSDHVLQNLPNESMLAVKALEHSSGGKVRLLIREIKAGLFTSSPNQPAC